MKQGDSVGFMAHSSESNGHFSQPGIVTQVWDAPTEVNVKVFPDGGNHVYDATSVKVVADEHAATELRAESIRAGNPYWGPFCWPLTAPAAAPGGV